MRTTMSSRQMQLFLMLAEQKRLTPDRMTRILGSGILADVLDMNADLSNREAVRRALKLGALLPESIILEVNYDEDLETMIAAGNYNYRNSNITAERFPIKGKGIVKFEAKLVYPNCDISSDDAEYQIKTLDTIDLWVPGKIEHLCAFGKQFPDEQRKYPIVGLGSVAEVGGGRHAPCLDGSDSGRSLYIGCVDLGWDGVCRFLAVRKISAS